MRLAIPNEQHVSKPHSKNVKRDLVFQTLSFSSYQGPIEKIGWKLMRLKIVKHTIKEWLNVAFADKTIEIICRIKIPIHCTVGEGLIVFFKWLKYDLKDQIFVYFNRFLVIFE